MTIETLVNKVIPPLVVALIIALMGMTITVSLIESRVETMEVTDSKQWEFISDNTKKSIRNEEKITCMKEHCGIR